MTPDHGTTSGTVLVGLLLSLPLLVLVPAFLITAYKSSLTRWMGATVQGDLTDAKSTSPDPLPTAYPPSSWLTLARSRQLRCALVYTIAGTLAAAALTLALLAAAGSTSLVAFSTIFAANLWPVLLTVGSILRWPRQTWLRAVILYLSVLLILAILRHALLPHTALARFFLSVILLNTPATIFYRAISLRRIRQVGPTLLPFCIAIIMGPQVLLHLGATHFSIALWIARLAIALQLTNLGGITLVTLITIFIMALLGRTVAFLLASLYRARYLSDQMLLLDALWLLAVGTQALVLLTLTGSETGSGTFWVLISYPVYLATVRLGLRVVLPRSSAAPSLLVLRSFALQQRAEAVFQPLTALWRYLGPVRLIGAPDLAAATTEPGIFLEFVSGRLRTLFLRTVHDLATRLSQQSSAPDPDARFRMDDFFCFKNTWQPTVSSLIPRSHLIFADFRGLAQTKGKGCEWEIQELVHSASLPRCVFFLEDTADAHYLHALLTPAHAPHTPVDPVRILYPNDLTGRSFEDGVFALFSAEPNI